jgi:hypothetical protein
MHVAVDRTGGRLALEGEARRAADERVDALPMIENQQ